MLLVCFLLFRFCCFVYFLALVLLRLMTFPVFQCFLFVFRVVRPVTGVVLPVFWVICADDVVAVIFCLLIGVFFMVRSTSFSAAIFLSSYLLSPLCRVVFGLCDMLFCVSFAISRFEIVCLPRLESIVIVWSLSLTMRPFLCLKWLSSFVFFVLFLIRIVESVSFGSLLLRVVVRCRSPNSVSVFLLIFFMVFGFCPNTFSNGLLPLVAAAVRRANRRRFKPAFPFSVIIVFSALMRSFIVRISLSTLPFPRWSLIGHSTCEMKRFPQNVLNFSPRNIVARSVLILFGMPF